MSLPAFQTTVVNATGDILTAAIMTITVEGTGAPAVLFSDRNGTISLGVGGVFPVNGITAFAQFYTAPGNYRVTANDAGSGFSETWRYVVLTGTAAEADTGLSTGNVPTADDLGMVGQTLNWHGGNYQPTDPVGLGVAKLMANASGGTIPPGGTMVGQGLQQVAVLSTGGIAAGSSGGTGNIWLNDSDLNIGNGNAATFTRIS